MYGTAFIFRLHDINDMLQFIFGKFSIMSLMCALADLYIHVRV